MSRFYDLTGQPQTQIPVVDGSHLRATHIGDAKKFGWVASVSTICGIVKESDFLTQWKVNQHLDAAKGTADLLSKNHHSWKKRVGELAEKEMSKAPELGSRVHALVEHYQRLRCSGGDMKVLAQKDPDLLPYLTAVHQFSEEHGVKAFSTECIEKRVVVPSARSAGTLDFMGSFYGSPQVLLDWKTQKVRKEPWYYFNFPLQLAAYWKGLGGKGGICSVIIDTSGHQEYDVDKGVLPAIYFKQYDSPLTYFKMFKNLSEIYYKMNDWEK